MKCYLPCTCVGPRYIELFLHSTEDTGGPQAGGGAAGGMKYGQQPQTQQGWGDNRAQVGDKGERDKQMYAVFTRIVAALEYDHISITRTSKDFCGLHC